MVTLDVNPFESNDDDFDGFDAVEPTWHDVVAAVDPEDAVFRCSKCTYKSQSQELFDRHVTRHSTDQPFECTLCDCKVSNPSRFVDHLVFHQQSEFLQCPFCSHASLASTMKLHMLEHTAVEVFDCSACEFTTNNPKALKRHAEVYHSPVFKCEYCEPPNLTRMTKQSLIEHWDEVHGITQINAETPTDAFDQSNNPTSSKPDSTSIYHEVVVKSEHDQDSELGIFDCLNTQSLNRINSNGSIVAGGFTDDAVDETYDCPVCEFSSPVKVLLKFHIFTMHTKEFTCKHCSAVMSKHALIQHSWNAHGIQIFFNGRGPQKANIHSETRVNTIPNFAKNPKSKSQSEGHVVPAKMSSFGEVSSCSLCMFSPASRSLVTENIRRPVVMTQRDLVEHGVLVKAEHRSIDETQLSIKTENDDAFGNSDEDPDRVDAWSTSEPVEVSRYVVQKLDRFVCSICKYSALSRSNVERHFVRVHVKKYHCKYCPVIMSRYDLIEHSMAIHGVSMSVKSRGLKAVGEDFRETSQGMDDTSFGNGYYETYPNSNNGVKDNDDSYITGGTKPFACSICDFSSHIEWSLTCHMKFMHTVKYHCNHCPAIMTKYDIVKHSLSEHGVEIRPRGPSGLREARDPESQIQNFPNKEYTKFATDMGVRNRSSTNVQNGSFKTNSPFSCAICEFVGKTNWHVMKHMDMFHRKKFQCPHCPAVMTKHKLINHGWNTHGVLIKAKNRFLKVVSEDSGSNDSDGNTEGSDWEGFADPRAQLEQALPSEDPLTKTACSFCDYTSPWPSSVQKHVQNMHVIKYCCERCSVVMPKHDLIQHYKIKHGVVINNRGHQFKKALGGSNRHAFADPAIKIEPVQENIPGSTVLQGKSDRSTSKTRCSYCEYKSVVSKDVRLHIERMHKVKFLCDRCPTVMAKYDLLRHYKTKHGVVLQNNCRFREASNVGRQELGHHIDTVQSDDEISEFEQSSVKGNSAKGEPCSFCEYKGDRYRVGVHVLRMHTRKFQCEHCAAVMTKYDLIRHYRDLHGVPINDKGVGGIRRLKASAAEEVGSHCGMPEAVHPQPGTKEAKLTTANTETVSCSVCDFSTKSSLSLETHTKNWHRRKYVCNYCPAVMTKHEVIEHSKDVHGVIIPRIGKPIQTIKRAEQDPGEVTDDDIDNLRKPTNPGFKVDGEGKPFKCDFCRFSTLYRKAIVVHVMNMHRKKYSCNNCSAVLTKHELLLHSKDTHGVEIPNNGRGYVFKQLTNYSLNESQMGKSSEVGSNSEPNLPVLPCANAVLAGDGTTRYKCSHCEFTSLYPFNVKIHEENLHTKLFCCDQCSAVNSKYELIQHYKNEHNTVVPHQRLRFREYHPESRETGATGGEQHPSSHVEGANPLSAEYGRTSAENEESDFLRSVSGRPRSTMEPEIRGQETGDSNEQAQTPGDESEYNQADETRESATNEQNPDDFTCSFCKWTFKYRKALRSHVNAMHLKKDVPSIDEMNTVEDDGSMTIIQEGEEFKCSICGFSTAFKFNLKPHFECFHRKKYSCNECSLVTTKYGIVCHYEDIHRFVIPNFRKGNLAQYCKPISDFPEDMDSSVIADGLVETVMDVPVTEMDDEVGDVDETIIEENGQFKCSLCDHSFARKSNLLAHVEGAHKRKYSCNRCSLIATKYNLVQHYETDHGVVIGRFDKTRAYFTAVDAVPEGIDSSMFPDSVEETSFMRWDCNWTAGAEDDSGKIDVIQVGEDYKCSFCSHAGKQKGNVKAHVEVFHKKKYSCNRCSVVLTKYEMLQHYESNHGVEIDKSGRGNKSQYFVEVNDEGNELDESVIDNTGSKESYGADENVTIVKEGDAFKCGICGYSSNSKASAGYHLNSHHRKFYSCNKCSVVLTKYEMCRHYETDHAILIPKQGFGPWSMAKYCKAVEPETRDSNSLVLRDRERENCGTERPDAVGGHSNTEKESDSGNDVGFIFKDGRDFRCSICEFSSGGRVIAERHFATAHKKKYSCNRCSVVMSKYDMLRHFEAEHGVEIPYSGRGRTAQYFKPVDPDVGPSESQMPSATASTSNEEVEGASEHKCTFCDHSFGDECNLKTHVEKMHYQTFSCNHCSAIMSKHDMIQHCKEEHGIGVSKKTSLNDLCFVEANPGVDGISGSLDPESTSSADSSSKTSTAGGEVSTVHPEDKDFMCNICDFTTSYEKSMEMHVVNFHQRKFACNHCQAFFTKHSLLEHCKKVHGVILSSRNPNFQEVIFPRKDTGNVSRPGSDSQCLSSGLSGGITMFECSMCDFSSKLRMHLQVHKKNMHSTKHGCNICSEVMTKHELLSHSRNVHGAVQGASISVSGASEEQDDVTDAEALQARNTFDCTICNFTTKAKWYFKDHMTKFHKTKFHCSHCPAVLTRHALIKHCKHFHGVVYTARQPFRQASDVDSSVADGSFDAEHGDTSTAPEATNALATSDPQDQEADRARCSKCDFSTMHKWYLKEHVESFHKKKFACSQCPAVMTKHELVKHSREKHGVTLNRRGKMPSAFTSSAQAQYKYAPSSEFKKPKRFPCDLCSFSSFHPFGLKRHTKIHHTIKYPCQHCSAVMTRYELIQHCLDTHNTRIPENDPDESKSVDDFDSQTTVRHSGDHTYSVPVQEPAESQVVNPKFQDQSSSSVQSPAFQPVVALERLPIDVDDLGSSFPVEEANDSAVVTNPKFHDPSR